MPRSWCPPTCSKLITMKRNKFLLLQISLVALVLLPKVECQVRRQRPLPLQPVVPSLALCAAQFALVNHACAQMPYNPAPPLTPPSPPVPPPDDSESGHRHGNGHGHRHSHRHRRRHGHRHRETPQVENDCCRWLKEVDNECVCDLLVHLPIFLAKPVHEYTVIVNEDCKVTYNCTGRIRP